MKTKIRTRRWIATVIAMFLALQMIIPAEPVNASVVSEELLTEADNGPEYGTDIPAAQTEGDELVSDEAGPDAVLEEAALESEGLLEDDEEGLLSQDTDNGGDEPEQDMVSDDDFGADSAAPAAADIKDVTVMLYCVGSDLEGNQMSATLDICEIMEGINASGIKDPDVNFIVETGGVKTDKQGRSRAKVIADRKGSLAETYPDKTAAYTAAYDYLTKGDNKGFKGISWLKNERYEIYNDELVPALNQPTNPDRLMTRADNNAVQELAEFIKTTKENYPARRYMLILWDHGGGPKGGLGNDERDEGEGGATFQAWHIEPTMKAAGVTSRDKFSYVNYDACLMGNLETALAWTPYADYFCGSEDLEPGDGDFYENWVSLLCKAADDPKNDFKNNAYVNTLMEDIGKKNVNDFYDWYTDVEDNGTKSLIKLSETSALASALSGYAKTLTDLFNVDPLEAYYGIYVIRAYTQDFNGRDSGIVDLNDFIKNMSDLFDTSIDEDAAKGSRMKAAVVKFKTAGNKVVECENKAVLLHEETSQYEGYSLGGVTTFLPYLCETEDVAEYFDGYKTVSTTNPLKDYKNFIGTFSALHEAGKLIVKNETDETDIDSKLKSVLNSYGIGSIYNGNIKKLSAEVMDHRIQEEGMKIYKNNGKYYYKRRDFKLVYDVYQSPMITVKGEDNKDYERALGYLPAGPYTDNGEDVWSQELINYEEQEWFGFTDNNGKNIPVAIYSINPGYEDGDRLRPRNPFTAETEMQVPVLYEGKLHMLDVSFKAGSTEGSVLGLWPFEYKARTYSRYINIDQVKDSEITILGDVPNALEGEEGVDFDDSDMGKCSLGTITLNKNTRLKRKIKLGGEGSNIVEGISNVDMRYFMRDLFGSYYFFDDIDEDIKVSLDSRAGSKRAGETIKAGELGLKVTGQKGDVYTDSEFDEDSYNYYIVDENGNKKKLVVKDGVYGTEEDDGFGPDTAAGDSSDMSPDKAENTGFKPITVDKDIKIIVEPGELKIENMEKVDGATEDLEKYFNLQTGQLEVTVKVADRPPYTTQFINESKPGSKMARACYIEPVTYTGRNILTTQSTGNGSKVVDIVLYSEDGKSILKEGTDYTVTYRYNKNVPPENEKHCIPCAVILGKGEYAGMKYLALFKIQEADMKDVVLSFDRRFAPLTSKGISLKITATLPSGVTIPSNQLKFHYYYGTEELTLQQLAEKFTSEDKMIPLTVRAEALSNAKNIKTGTFTAQYPKEDVIYACPKSKGSFNVSLTNNNVSVNDGIKGEDLLTARLKKANIGRDEFKLSDLQFHGVYYDRDFKRRVDGDKLSVAGTCYIAVSLNAENQKRYSNYNVKALNINVKDGVRLNRNDITIKPAEYKVTLDRLAGRPIPVTLVINRQLSWDKLTLTCSTRNGGNVVKTISASDMNNGKIVLNGIDNSAPGNYTIQVSSAGKTIGNQTLRYKVIK